MATRGRFKTFPVVRGGGELPPWESLILLGSVLKCMQHCCSWSMYEYANGVSHQKYKSFACLKTRESNKFVDLWCH